MSSGLAHAAPTCLTEAQARVKYHGKHLFWHPGSGRERCWNETKKHSPIIKRHVPTLFQDPPTDANGNPAQLDHSVNLLGVTWYAMAFGPDDPIGIPLEPKNYDPRIKPDFDSAGLIVYAPDEFNEIDATAIDPPWELHAPPTPFILSASFLILGLGMVVMSCVSIRHPFDQPPFWA
jgi:hypothetical protein